MRTWLLAVSLMAILLSGCASQGKHTVVSLAKYKSVCFAPTDPFDQAYIPPVAASLKKFGFDVSPVELDPDTLICMVSREENGVFDFTFHISLWAKRKKVLEVEARDSEFGSRGSAQEANDALLREVLADFERKLEKARNPGTSPDKS